MTPTRGRGAGHRQSLDRTVGADEVDGAPVREVGDREPGEPRQHAALLAHRRQQRARLGEESQGGLGAELKRDVAHHHHQREGLALLAADDRELGLRPQVERIAMAPAHREGDVLGRSLRQRFERAVDRGKIVGVGQVAEASADQLAELEPEHLAQAGIDVEQWRSNETLAMPTAAWSKIRR